MASLVQEPGRFGLSYQEADELREKVEGLLHISTVPWITHGPNLTSDFSYHMLNVHAMIESFISSENMSDELPEVLAVLNQTASSLPDVASLFVYDAVWSLAIGLAAAENDVPGWLNGDCGALVNCHGAALSSRIRHARFSGASGNVGFIRDPISDSVFNVGAAGDRDAFAVPSSIEFYNSSARAWTTVGKLLAGSAQNGESSSLSLGQPITWPGGYASLSAPPDGASCSVGEYFSNVTLECLPCKPGYYSSERGSSTCLLCKAGEVCSHHGCSACSTCPQGSWQDGTQPTGCTLCPQNTGTAGVGAMALAECQCSAGFYRRDGLPGRVCYPCPDGGECLGSSHPPFPKLGYYGDWSMVDPGVGDSEQAASSISNSLFLKCSADWHCKNSDCIALDSATIDDDALRNGRLAECRSNVSNLCHPAYEGMMCGRCSAGYFSLGGACLKCQEPKILFTVGLIVVVVLVWYLINR